MGLRTEAEESNITAGSAWLQVKPGKGTKKMRFYLRNLGKDRFIVGYPLWTFKLQPTDRLEDCSKSSKVFLARHSMRMRVVFFA